ncbi:mavicyanin isoform X1 [Prosopis cineraria]|uniref:mavicyanin isoform X1 n=1 Tax=Prosopis cineraria TaxID=364024 RepID=UPI00240FBC14|nr:mavicyanin isoform X1 [Prosopis cineraria]
MGLKNTIFLALIASLFAKEALAAQYEVGGSQGWDESTDFNTWSSGQTFKVGDQLVFKYSSGLHSVVEFGSESDFKNCDISNPVNSMSSGNDVVKLNKAGTRYFACGTAGHCAQGMRVKITTVAGNAPSTPSSSSSSSSSPASTASAACASQGLAVSIMLIFAFFVVSLFGSY